MRVPHSGWRRDVVFVAILLVMTACAGPPQIEDPMAVLRTPEAGSRAQLAAMAELDQSDASSPEYIAALKRVVWVAGYTVTAREAAVTRLERDDLEGLKRTLRQKIPVMNAWAGRTRLCEIVAERGWVELTPALVSSWAQPVAFVTDEWERPEALALAQLYPDRDRVDIVFEVFVTENRPSAEGLRTRAWTLLHRLGERERLVVLLQTTAIDDDDAFLADLAAGATELGIVPHNREEILWLRELRKPQNRMFWDEACAAMSQLPASRRSDLELRDLPIVVAAARHAPELLEASPDELYVRLESRLAGAKHHAHSSAFDNTEPNRRERLHEWRLVLTWGDLAAMLIIVQALEVPEVIEHLFSYADRDQADGTTEYGGVLALDRRGRFEVLEFPPRIRHHDEKFVASQAMLDAAYTSLAHFHFHVQRPSNRRYAGPGFGDVTYADNTRANCLVLTSIKQGHMNVDFYRHGRVIVDLGTFAGPSAG